MNFRITAATVSRVLAQLRADHRTLGLVVGVPVVLATLLYFVFGADEAANRSRFAPIAWALVAILPMVVMFLVTSVAVLRERTGGTLERLFTTPLRQADLLIAYAIAFGAAALLQAAVLVGVTRWVLRIGTDGPIVWTLLVAVVAAVVGVSLGLVSSAFARSEFQAVQFMPIVIGPQLFLCGLLVPRDTMPDVLRWASEVLPMTYAVDALRTVGASTDPTGDVLRDVGILSAFVAAALLVGALTMPRATR